MAKCDAYSVNGEQRSRTATEFFTVDVTGSVLEPGKPATFEVAGSAEIASVVGVYLIPITH